MMKNAQDIGMLLFAILVCVPALAEENVSARPDLMTFSEGVLPIVIDTGGATLRVTMGEAISAIDGNPVGYVLTPKPGMQSDIVEITYALPAPTRFDRFAVPNVSETPSPSQTFFETVEVLGSSSSSDGPYVPLAKGVLETHTEPDSVSELSLAANQPEVLWVKVRLSGGINVERDSTFFEFSELIGNGEQQTPPLSSRFSGVWDGRGVDIELAQDGPTVEGCYDKNSQLAGTVEGRVLRALGANSAGIPSQFILIAAEDGSLHGLRSTNGAPFKPYDGTASDAEPVCLPTEAPVLGCGSIVHGIGFDYDSANIRPQSDSVLQSLFSGLSASKAKGIRIVGHSSSEGGADYNRDLSERRAHAVADALVELGLGAGSITAAGRGEDEPIASNDDEAGRSLNRRVEIDCSG